MTAARAQTHSTKTSFISPAREEAELFDQQLPLEPEDVDRLPRREGLPAGLPGRPAASRHRPGLVQPVSRGLGSPAALRRRRGRHLLPLPQGALRHTHHRTCASGENTAFANSNLMIIDCKIRLCGKYEKVAFTTVLKKVFKKAKTGKVSVCIFHYHRWAWP